EAIRGSSDCGVGLRSIRSTRGRKIPSLGGASMKRLAYTTLAVVAIAGLLSTPGSAGGLKAGLGPQLWEFNVISIPDNSNSEDTNGSWNTARSCLTGSQGTPSWKFDPDAKQYFDIYDCDGTDGAASVIVDERLTVDIAVRLLGPNKSELNIVCMEVKDDGTDD